MLHDALAVRRMGHILNLVQNHMGIAASAERGQRHPRERPNCTRFFDIEWHPVKDELADKLLIPILAIGMALCSSVRNCSSSTTVAPSSFAVLGNAPAIAPDTFSTIFSVHLDAWVAEQAGGAPTSCKAS